MKFVSIVKTEASLN